MRLRPDPSRIAPRARESHERLLSDVLDLCPHAVAVASRTGAIIAWNRAFEESLRVEASRLAQTSCCQLFGCRRAGGPLERVCLTDAALGARAPLPEVELVSEGRPILVTAAPLPAHGSGVVLHVRPAKPSASGSGAPPRLRIYTLGETRVETADGALGGDWLEQRTGQLLKFLTCRRHSVVPTDEIAESVWPSPRATTPSTVRYFVHELREKLEPDRPRHVRSSLVPARRGGYTLSDEAVWIDADEFEARVKSGVAAFANGEGGAATDHLERALSLYRGDFLADEPYAEWALSERERLRELAQKPLSLLCRLRADDLEAAAGYLERLAEMEPFDQEIHRKLLEVWMRQGRRSRAVRHYHALELRLMREFDEQPSFDLSDLVA